MSTVRGQVESCDERAANAAADQSSRWRGGARGDATEKRSSEIAGSSTLDITPIGCSAGNGLRTASCVRPISCLATHTAQFDSRAHNASRAVRFDMRGRTSSLVCFREWHYRHDVELREREHREREPEPPWAACRMEERGQSLRGKLMRNTGLSRERQLSANCED